MGRDKDTDDTEGLEDLPAGFDPEAVLEAGAQKALEKQAKAEGRPYRREPITAWIVGDEVVEKGHAFDYLQKAANEHTQEKVADLAKRDNTEGDDPFVDNYVDLKKVTETRIREVNLERQINRKLGVALHKMRKRMDERLEKSAATPEERVEALQKATHQIYSDFLQQATEAGAGTLTVIRPPYSLEQLLYLRELHPLHSAALEQMVADVVGNGFGWKPTQPDADETELINADNFIAEPNPDMTFLEIMQAVWLDRRTLGWGLFEVVRNGGGKVDEIWHIPAHTLRIRYDNERYLQTRSGKYVWFKRWGDKRHLNAVTGQWSDVALPELQEATELFAFKMPTGRSSYYAIPGYVSAISSISTLIALDDYNRTFFTRYAVPSWAIILEGADLTPALKTTIETYFKNEIRGNPHRVLTLSLPYHPVRQTGENRVKVTFTRLSDQVRDMSFRYLNQALSLQVLIAHRMPPYRVGWPITGSLGGSSAEQMNVMYKTGVVNPEQAIARARMTRFFRVEYGIKQHEFDFKELDITDEQTDMTYAVNGLKGVVMLVDEARARVGLHPLPNQAGQVLVLPGGYALYNPETGELVIANSSMGASLDQTGGKQNGQAKTKGGKQGGDKEGDKDSMEPNPPDVDIPDVGKKPGKTVDSPENVYQGAQGGFMSGGPPGDAYQ